jgi:hypothetical protein
LDLQLSMQSVPITTNVMRSNPDHGGSRRVLDRMVVGLSTAYAISAFHL